MVKRSGLVSIALIMIPNIIVIAFRILSPELDEVLSNDDMGQIVTHIFATIIGIILAFRYSRVHDHEYRRSKAIDALSKTYKMEDKGLWEKGEVAIQRLEARAHSDFRGRKASFSRKRMQGSIGQINRESGEAVHEEDNSEYSVSINGIEIVKERKDEQKLPDRKFSEKMVLFFSSLVEKSANKRSEKKKQEKKKKQSVGKEIAGDIQSFRTAGDSRWAIPEGTQRKARLCNSCSTYNDAVSDYCTSCGSFMK